MIVLIALGYSLPYWLSFSHPTYHLPVVPLFAVLGASLIARLTIGGPRSFIASIVASRRRRYGLVLVLVLFALMQVEWIAFGLSRV